jgi:G3E family GTPase
MHVIRYQVHAQVQMAHWRDFQALLDELNTAVRTKGFVPFQLWEAAFGRFNEALMVAEYETLEAYEREQHALHADAAYMNLWREMGTHMDGIPWTDLWWRPSEAV